MILLLDTHLLLWAAHDSDKLSARARELMPQDLKLEVDQFSRGQAVKAARYLAFVVGKAHARQLGKERKKNISIR